ncbi:MULTISPECIES: hypothetical protein [unclassified Bradyrhizobium]
MTKASASSSVIYSNSPSGPIREPAGFSPSGHVGGIIFFVNGSNDALSTVLRNVLGDQVTERDSHKTLGEYRAELIATELASAKAREAALRVEIARLKLESASAADTQVQIEGLRLAVDLEREARQQADLAAAEAQELLDVIRPAILTPVLPHVRMLLSLDGRSADCRPV